VLKGRSSALGALLVALLALAAGIAAERTGALRRLDLIALDARYRIGGPHVPTGDIAFVSFDERSQDEFRERFGTSRRRIIDARIIDRLRGARPRVIAYDFQFTERGERPDDDGALLDAIYGARGIILATAEVADGNHEVLGGPPAIRAARARVGDSTFPEDQDGVLRRMAYAPRGLPTFAVVAARAASGRPVPRAPFGRDGAMIAYPRKQDLLTVPAWRAVDGTSSLAALRDKIVIVGAGDPSLGDIHPTPIDGAMPGALIHAYATATAMAGFPLRRAPGGVAYLVLAALAVVPPLVAHRQSAWRMLGAALGALAALLVGAQIAFRQGWALRVDGPLVALIAATAGAFGASLLREIRERRRTRLAFGRFVPEQVADDAIARQSGDLRVGGSQLVATVMFCDLRGFTQFCESLSPERVIEVLNHYLGEMSDAITEHGGTVADYMGDGIMAVFGAPTPLDDHADRAVAAAAEMSGPRLARFNGWVTAKLGCSAFRMGIGLNSGMVISGNVGSASRVGYAAIGDTTNTASRLEGMTKGSGHQVFVAGSTRSLLTRPAPGLVFVDVFPVRGRRESIEVWALDEPSVASAGDEATAATEG